MTTPYTIISRQGVEQNRRQFKEQPFGEDLGNDITLEMAAIPGGTFLMGSPPNEKYSFDDEYPQHQVTVPPFFMGKYPITQAQWKEVASRTDLKVKQDLDLNPAHFKDRPDSDRRPVEQVNWYDAVEFCARLSKLTGREYRLPSEAEWEYACRAGTITPFHFGETITGELANYRASYTYADEPKGEYRQQTTPVGQFPPNAFGLYDMHGNVWEWCMDDWHDNYDGAPSDGSVWLDNNQEENIDAENSLESTEKAYSAGSLQDENNLYPVMRGGSWANNPNLCRSAIRDNIIRRVSRSYLSGFRVVCVFGRTL
jgi:formylglycine-generating enzyme required for sulfatase activity